MNLSNSITTRVVSESGFWACISIHTSALNKRYNAIFYNRVMEDQAAGILRVGWIPGEFNLTDFFTKTTMPGDTRHNLVDSILSNTASPIGNIENV